jgi:hypothetical protein
MEAPFALFWLVLETTNPLTAPLFEEVHSILDPVIVWPVGLSTGAS